MKHFGSDRETAVIVGAGASAAFGYPITAELLPLIWKLANDPRSFDEDTAALGRLKTGLQQLVPSLEDTTISPPLITDILSILDQSIAAGSSLVVGMTQRKQVEFRTLLDRALVDTIHRKYGFGADGQKLRERFVSWLLRSAASVVTTNYDLELDFALERELHEEVMEGKVDYGFDWRSIETQYRLVPRPHNPDFRLYKLHGSLNWLNCPVCEHTYINLQASIQDRAFDTKPHGYNTCHCGHFPLSPVIVSPSFVRNIRIPDLLYLWKNTLEHLRLARKWVIIGYSLPTEDLAIRSLLMRAYRGREEKAGPPEVLVILRDSSDEKKKQETRSRFKSIFPNADVKWCGVEGFIDTVEDKGQVWNLGGQSAS